MESIYTIRNEQFDRKQRNRRKDILFQKRGEKEKKEDGDTKGSQGRNELAIENNRLGYVFRRDTSFPCIHLGTSFPTPRDHQHHLLRITAVLALGLHTVCRQFHVSARVERLFDKTEAWAR